MTQNIDDLDWKAIKEMVLQYLKIRPDERKHELNILVVKIIFLALLLTGATWLTLNGKLSQDLTAALYGAVVGYLISSIKI
ncbi:Uncharacterised protein [Candidatus Bilamarchaeum dharawalense]|uniref:Uncharacterized protein n=1 Tax=Candidatus Bilamarchaeum dharawalense TaxID=2885759 RepID=A0A5E4LQN5_9ARCH|nr:Uncharacterised protein [Candidatus Bilamarchaeum dharawalense]